MKPGKNKKKLVLRKISIAQLDKDKIQEVKEGLPLIKGGNLNVIGGLNMYITEYPPPICVTT